MLNMKMSIAGVAFFAGLAALTTANAQDADPVAGEKVFKKCQSCHDVKGKNKIGPHLDGVVGRPVASIEGFKYSPAITEYAAGQPEWTEEALTAFLRKPKDVIAKTKMTFAGLKKDEDIANVIAFLKDHPAAE